MSQVIQAPSAALLLRDHWQSLNGHDFVALDEARAFIERMRDEEPEALDEWMIATIVRHTALLLGRFDRERRATTARQLFAEVAGAGDRSALRVFKIRFVVDEQHTHRCLGKMTATDCLFTSSHYETKGRRMLAFAAFLRAIGKKTGTRKVADVINEAECEQLMRSFLGREQVEILAA